MSRAKSRRIRIGKTKAMRGSKRAYQSGIGMSMLNKRAMLKKREKDIIKSLQTIVTENEDKKDERTEESS